LLLFLSARGEPRATRRPPIKVALAVSAVLAVALAARVVDLADLPLAFHGDMAEMGLGGRDLLRGRVASFVWVGWASIPRVGFLPAALGLALFDDLTGLRLSAALLGSAAVAGVYLLGGLLFGRRVGIVAAGASAIGYTEVHFSRLPAYGDPVPFLVFGLYFLLRGLRTGGRLSFALAGSLTGAACLLYYSGRVAPVLVAAVLGHELIVRPSRLRQRRRGLTVAALAALVTLGPMIVFFAEHPAELNARHREVSVFNPRVSQHLLGAYHLSSMPQVIAHQAVRSALVFHHTGDTSLQGGFPWPMLSPFLAPLAALGLAVCVTRLRATGPALLVAWWASIVLGAAVFTSDAPFWPRLVVVLPAAALLVAIGLDRTCDALAAFWARCALSNRARLLVAAALLALTGAVNWSWYTSRARLYVDAAEWLGRLVAAEPEARFCMVPGPLSFREEEIRFLAPGRDLLEIPLERIEHCLSQGRVFVVYPVEQATVLAEVRRLAPDLREVAHNYPNGLPGPMFLYPSLPSP